MSTVRIINVSSQIWGSVTLLVILLCVVRSGRNKRRTDKLFEMLLTLQILIMSTDALALYFRGRLGLFNSIGVRASNFASFFCSNCLAFCFLRYMDAYMERKTGRAPGKKGDRIARAIFVATNVLLVINLFVPILYRIDEANLYSRASGYVLVIIPYALILLIALIHLLKNWHYLENTERLPFLIYIAIPAVALVPTTLTYGIVWGQIGDTFAALFMFVLIQVEQGKRMMEQEEKLVQSRIDMTLSQLRPHFLYNTLSTISMLCLKDPKLASAACDRFAKYLRVNLDTINKHSLISFEEELNHVKTYVWLEELRFGEDLIVTYHLDATEFMLPALTVQPLVENAVKHGLMGKEGACHIDVITKKEGDMIVIGVVDDGIGFDQTKEPEDGRSHIGMKNVEERLRYMAKGTIRWYSEVGKGTSVWIRIPMDGEGEK